MKKDYKTLSSKQNGWHILLEVPQVPDNTQCIKEEVKQILSDLLREQLTKLKKEGRHDYK